MVGNDFMNLTVPVAGSGKSITNSWANMLWSGVTTQPNNTFSTTAYNNNVGFDSLYSSNPFGAGANNPINYSQYYNAPAYTGWSSQPAPPVNYAQYTAPANVVNPWGFDWSAYNTPATSTPGNPPASGSPTPPAANLPAGSGSLGDNNSQVTAYLKTTDRKTVFADAQKYNVSTTYIGADGMQHNKSLSAIAKDVVTHIA
jgi:hypothetical protein